MRLADHIFYLELLLSLSIGLIVVSAVAWGLDLRTFSHVLLGASVAVLAVVLVFRPPARADRWRRTNDRDGASRIATQSIYIPLLGNREAALRPIDAIHLRDVVYLIPPDADVPFHERWRFTPGTVVKCEVHAVDGRERLVAVEAVRY